LYEIVSLAFSSFSTCLADASIALNNIDIEYNQDTGNVTFSVSGTRKASQDVSAVLEVTAFNKSVYSMDFNPYDASRYIAQLCPSHTLAMILR
jgi:hypothetical protein